MVRSVLFLAIAAFSFGGLTPLKKDTVVRAKPDVGKYETYDLKEVSPEFPGGQEKFHEFIRANLKKISSASGKKVIIVFFIEPDGSVTDITIGRGLNPEANQEAVRVMKLSPKWTPGTQMGKPVRLACTVVMKFD